jgi:ubiquinone/menaquinone biosynthesis C-methylase UbiE
MRCYVACFQNDLARAESLADRALQDLPEEDRDFRPSIFGALGDTYRRNGFWEEAKESYLRVLQYPHAPTVQVQAAHVYGALADLHLRQGRLRDGAGYWRQALAAIREGEKQGRVPAIGEPLANGLIRLAAVRPDERVLDVACGTGIVARLVSDQVDSNGTVAGVDINPGMLEVARSNTPADMSIEWHESAAEDMPLPDEAFDVVLCQLSLQFIPDKLAALQEMHRVLAPGGRLLLNLPGPAGNLFVILAEAMERHISAEAAGFVTHVFSLHDTTEIEQLLGEAGFHDIAVQAHNKTLDLPPAKEFLWQYVHSTPLAGVVANADEKVLATLERDVVQKWQDFEEDGSLIYQQRVVVATARK